MNTKFSYMYRDAANWKDHYEVIVAGELSEEEIQTILDCCDGENFVARKVGLPGGMFPENASYDPRFDHPFCEHNFEDSFEKTEKKPTETITAKELVAAFVANKGKWDET